MPRRNKVTQARSQSQKRKSHQNRESRPEAKPEVKPEPQPESEQPKPDPQPEPKPEPKPEVVAESPEKVADRVKDAFAKAKTAADFRVIAVDALKLIDQANTSGKQDVAKSVVTLALSAARKADSDELTKAATLCILEPGAEHPETDATLIEATAPRVYLDDLEESDVHIGDGKLGKHGRGPDFSRQPVLRTWKSACPFIASSSASERRVLSLLSTGRSVQQIPLNGRNSGRQGACHAIDFPSARRWTCTLGIQPDKRSQYDATVRCFCRRNQGPHFRGILSWGATTSHGLFGLIPSLLDRLSHSSGRQAAVPDAAAQEQALKLIREVFKDKYSTATTSEKQKALSQELLQKAQATADDVAGQYVMLKEAGQVRHASQGREPCPSGHRGNGTPL